MNYPDSFAVSLPSPTEILIERDFDAPLPLVFAAFTRPDLVRQWLTGPDGWTMPVCEIDLRVGGRYRYVWANAARGQQMGLGGEFRAVEPDRRIVATERFDEAWYPGEAIGTTEFSERDGRTRVAILMRYESTAARDTAKFSGMETGMAAGYDRLERLLPGFRSR